LAGALPLVGQAFTRARSLYFSLIQSQIVCVDDLDRRSKNLDLKDVLGLISFLREQRGCKVAVLLNAGKLGDNKAEFDALLEKVVETKVVLAPTAAESAAIALPDPDAISVALRAHCETLGIRNIRVIKQIERLVRRVDALLTGFTEPIRKQATHSVTLFGWSKYDRDSAPTMEFLKIRPVEHRLLRDEKAPRPEREKVWETLMEKYQFSRADDFDLALMEYVDSMVFNAEKIVAEARALQEQQRIGALHGTFEAAWRTFHDSFDENEDRVVRDIVEGAKRSYEVVSLRHLNEMISFLKRLGRKAEATDVLQFFAHNRRDVGYWTPQDDPFEGGPFDPEVSALIEQKKPIEPKEFDVSEALIRAGRDFDSDTIAKLARVPAQTYCDLISGARGERLRSLVLSAFEFRRILNATDDMRRVVSLMEEALRLVGRKSRLNKLRIKKYGVSIED
jgi:hypothetical protein